MLPRGGFQAIRACVAPGRRSLRFRILASFAVSGAILGPLVGVALLFLTVELQEWATERSIEARLAAVVATPGDYVLRSPASIEGVEVLASVPADRLPDALLRLPDGIHEYETSTKAWLVGMATTPQGRYAVVEDISILENRERHGFVIAGIGTLVAMYAALLLGFYLSRRLLAPIIRLSERVSHMEREGVHRPIAEEFADDEVGALAAALDRYYRRTNEALRRERDFSSDASHELRNPLTVIQNAAEIIEDDASLSASSRRAVLRIIHSARYMSETVAALLLMIRERPEPQHDEVVPIAEVVEHVLEREERVRQDRSVTPSWRCNAAPRIRGPRVAVEIIVANLVRNAFQHSRADSVRVELDADCLRVSDDGVGVSATDLARLTERGHRGANAAGSGAGLGLSIVQRLCDRFDWTLAIDSEPNAGTRAEWRFRPVD